MSRVDICAVGDIPAGGSLAVTVGDVPVALVRTEGSVYAIYDRCSHADVALSEGEVEGCAIECWLHGSSFDLRTGAPLSLPATLPVPVFPVEVLGDGDAARVLIDVTTPALP